jgi:hypothetical protein
MAKFLLFIFLFCGGIAAGQNNQPTKSQLLKAFKASIRQDKPGRISTNSNAWVICNTDNAFYKSDTLRLYSSSRYYSHSKCCDFTNWTFYKKDAFVLTRVQTCKEPTTGRFTRNDDWFTVKVSKENKSLFLETYNQGKLVDRFKVISIDKVDGIGRSGEITKVITLVRTGMQ